PQQAVRVVAFENGKIWVLGGISDDNVPVAPRGVVDRFFGQSVATKGSFRIWVLPKVLSLDQSVRRSRDLCIPLVGCLSITLPRRTRRRSRLSVAFRRRLRDE